MENITQEDLDSGKVVQTANATYWFKEPGNNMQPGGLPREEKLHRDNDLPAIVYKRGRKEWWKNGKLHRDGNLPAIIMSDGSEIFYKEGKLFRKNGLPTANWGPVANRLFPSIQKYKPSALIQWRNK